MKDRKILVNCGMCPDGTIITSRYTHDYVEHDGCFIDGGRDYARYGGSITLMTIYEDDSFEVIRRFFCRLNRGINGDGDPRWIPLFRMSDQWLDATIDYLGNRGMRIEWYQKEKEYRKLNNIKIEE